VLEKPEFMVTPAVSLGVQGDEAEAGFEASSSSPRRVTHFAVSLLPFLTHDNLTLVTNIAL